MSTKIFHPLSAYIRWVYNSDEVRHYPLIDRRNVKLRSANFPGGESGDNI